MTQEIVPSDSFIHFLSPPSIKSAPPHIVNILPDIHITHILGSGGSAEVYGATDSNERVIAIKIPQMRFDATIDASAYDRFAREADLWRKLKHRNIVSFYLASDQPLPHITIELMEGGSLRLLMNAHRLTVPESLHIITQILEGLCYAHRLGIVHRDLKPQNILFHTDGTAKITDWGIGKFMLSATMSKTRGTKGTMNYCSPEQFDRKKYGHVDWQTDIFQMGVMFYEMLTGVNPFTDDESAGVMGKVLGYDPKPPSSLNPEIPTALDEVVLGALEKIKGYRWRSADVMLFQLKQMMSGKDITRRSMIASVKPSARKLTKREVMEELIEKLNARLKELNEMKIDTSVLDGRYDEIDRHKKMAWYDEAIASANVMTKDLEGLYQQKMTEISQRRDNLRRNVKKLFSNAFFRNINVEHLYEHSRKAREATEEGDFEHEEEMNLQLKKELESLIVKHRNNMEFEDIVRKLGEEVVQLRERALIYGLDVEQEDNIIKSAFILLKGGKLKFAKTVFSQVNSHLKDSVGRYESAMALKRRQQYREIWDRSGKTMTVKFRLHSKKVRAVLAGRISNILERRKNFMDTMFIKIPERDYFMARCPVTQKEWRIVMGTAPWEGKRYGREGDEYPATYVTWFDAQKFVKELNQMEGVNRYRLPTEEEWEYCSRAGVRMDFCFGDDEKKLDQFAWYRKNAWAVGEKYAHKVGGKKPNAWGLHDMHGNVWEWCEGRYDEEEPARVVRGGSWDDSADYCRSGGRQGNVPDYENDDIGFRILRDV